MPNRLSLRSKIAVWIKVQRLKVLEFVRFDSRVGAFLMFFLYLIWFILVKITKGEFLALVVAGKMFRQARLASARKFAQVQLKQSIFRHGPQVVGAELMKVVLKNINKRTYRRLRSSVKEGKVPLFDRRLIILSPHMFGKKGVILVKYTEYFKYVYSLFDIKKISKDYVLVAEPSFSGYFDEDILCLMSEDIPVVVESPELVDFQFIKSLKANLYPVNIGSNCWVNPNVFYPIKGIAKKYDVIMVAIWADFKRHYHLFESMAKCRRKLRVALVGQPWPRTLEEMKELASYYGVLDQIEFFENVKQSELNILLNQSRCFLLLSKKEGPNKAIIEAMYADIPVFLLEGFNYGYRYPFINKKTGGFIKPNKLQAFLENLDEVLEKGDFSPSNWIRKHISPYLSTKKLVNVLTQIENEKSVRINKDLTIKVNSPSLDYLNPKDWKKMRPYYLELKYYLREGLGA